MMATPILLLDSDHITRTVLYYHLQLAGYSVHAVACADAAWEYLQHVPSALVIADELLLLTAQSPFAGWMLLAQTQHRPMVLLTVQHQTPSPVYGSSCVYLAKPVRARQLLQCIDSLLNSVAA